MTKLYQAEVDGKYAFDISDKDLDALDKHEVSEGFFHVLRENIGYDIEVISADFDHKAFVVRVNGQRLEVLLRDPVEVQVHAMGLDEPPAVHASDIIAPMPGLVLSVHVKEGDNVKEGDRLVILEAMKMENVLSAHTDGIIATVHVKSGQPVEKGQTLITFE